MTTTASVFDSQNPYYPEPSFLERVVMRLFKKYDIVKQVDGRESVYLRRYFILKPTKNFPGIYLHHICRSDDDRDPHDHPWSFLALILKGGYQNHQHAGFLEHADAKALGLEDDFRWGELLEVENCKPGRIYTRAAEHCHQVKLPEGKTSWSLVLTSHYKGRSWNFITPEGPVPWRQYLGLPEDYHYEAD